MKSINSKKVDIAWNKLYSQLDSEGLVSSKKDVLKPILKSRILRWGVSVAALVACIFIYSYFYSDQNVEMKTFLSHDKDFTTITSLNDGSIVGLKIHSSIEYPEVFLPDKRQLSLKGQAYFDIAKDENRKFIVETNKALVEVLGTAFCIESANEYFSISVQRGQVKVTPRDGRPSVYVEKGENLYLDSDNLKKKIINDNQIFSTYFEQIQFKDEYLSDIVKAINLSSSSMRIKIDPNIANRKLTIRFANGDNERVANLIALALNLSIKQEAGSIIIYDQDRSQK